MGDTRILLINIKLNLLRRVVKILKFVSNRNRELNSNM